MKSSMMLLTAEGEQAEIKLNSCPISHTSSGPAYSRPSLMNMLRGNLALRKKMDPGSQRTNQRSASSLLLRYFPSNVC